MPLLRVYADFVKAHPGLVQNVERLAHWVVYATPDRFSSSEYAYEGFIAALGLLGLLNESILAGETPGLDSSARAAAIWLAAVEQVQTLVELRGMQLERAGKMSRYVPLIGLELVRMTLRMRLWKRGCCTLALPEHSAADVAASAADMQLHELLQALLRLRQRHGCMPADDAAAGAAAAAAAARSALRAAAPGQQTQAACRPSSSTSVVAAACSVCGAAATEDVTDTSSTAVDAAAPPPVVRCTGCGSPLARQQQQQQSDSATPGSGSCGGSSSSSLRSGWWRQRLRRLCLSSSNNRSNSNNSSRTATLHEQSAAHLARSSTSPLLLLPSPRPWRLSDRDTAIGWGVVAAGEAAHLLRPLAYVVLLYRHGPSSWRPWLASLALDAASAYCLHTGRAIVDAAAASRWPGCGRPSIDAVCGVGGGAGVAGDSSSSSCRAATSTGGTTLYSLALLRALATPRWTPGERSELLARRAALARYLLRSPCYEAFTRKLLQRLVSGAQWLPGLGQLAEVGFSLVEGMQGYYTYVEA